MRTWRMISAEMLHMDDGHAWLIIVRSLCADITFTITGGVRSTLWDVEGCIISWPWWDGRDIWLKWKSSVIAYGGRWHSIIPRNYQKYANSCGGQMPSDQFTVHWTNFPNDYNGNWWCIRHTKRKCRYDWWFRQICSETGAELWDRSQFAMWTRSFQTLSLFISHLIANVVVMFIVKKRT